VYCADKVWKQMNRESIDEVMAEVTA